MLFFLILNLIINFELFLILYNNLMFFIEEKFWIMKINKIDIFFGDCGVLIIIDVLLSEFLVDIFLFMVVNDYDYYVIDFDFVIDYVDVIVLSLKEMLISMLFLKLFVKLIFDDFIFLLNFLYFVMVLLLIFFVLNSLEK